MWFIFYQPYIPRKMKNLVQFICNIFSSKVHARDSGFYIKRMLLISSLNTFKWCKMGTLTRNKLIIDLSFRKHSEALFTCGMFFEKLTFLTSRNTHTCAYQGLQMLVFWKNLCNGYFCNLDRDPGSRPWTLDSDSEKPGPWKIWNKYRIKKCVWL